MNKALLAIALTTLALAGCGESDRANTQEADRAGLDNRADTDQRQNAGTLYSQDQELLAVAKRHADALLSMSPELATDLGVGPEVAGDAYLSTLGGYGFDAHEMARTLNETFFKELQMIDASTLSTDQRLTYDVLLGAYRAAGDRNKLGFGGATPIGYSLPNNGDAWAVTPYFVTQLTGPHIALPRMLQTQHPFTSRDDVDAYLNRLGDFARAFDEVVETLGGDAALGIAPPTFIIDRTITVIDKLTEPDPSDHPLTQTISDKARQIDGLTESDIEAYLSRGAELISSTVYPAYDALKNELMRIREQASDDAGIWRFDDIGADYYAMALKAYGAQGRNADDVHGLGLAEVERIQGEMDVLLTSIGLEPGTVGERMQVLAQREDNLFPNTDEGRTQLLAELRAIIDEVELASSDWFNAVPDQALDVRRIPVHEQGSSPGGYYTGPSLDGSRPGTFWINLKNTADNPKHGLKTLSYHEGIPGHHLSIAFNRGMDGIPLLRAILSYSEYEEGWALYAEKLAKEMGMYANDPYGDLGRLQAELFRAARLVVDTGIHHKEWSREEAIDWMTAATGESRTSVTREVERYAAIPGQACAYKLGMIAIEELRGKAEKALGENFDIKEFHDIVLSLGSVPIDILSDRVDAWIASKQA